MVTLTSEQESRVDVHAPVDDHEHCAHKIRTASVEIEGIMTDIIVQPFSDRIFVIATQLQKLGTLVTADVDISPGGTEQYSIQVVMGKRDIPEIDMCARAIMAAFKARGCNRPLLLSLGLMKHDMLTIRAVVDKVGQMRAL